MCFDDVGYTPHGKPEVIKNEFQQGRRHRLARGSGRDPVGTASITITGHFQTHVNEQTIPPWL